MDSRLLDITTREFSKDDFYLLSIKQNGVLYPKLNIHITYYRDPLIPGAHIAPDWFTDQRLPEMFSQLQLLGIRATRKQVLIIYCEIMKQIDALDIPLIPLVRDLASMGHNTEESVKNVVKHQCDEEIAKGLATDPLFSLYRLLIETNIDTKDLGRHFLTFFKSIETELNDIFNSAKSYTKPPNIVGGVMMFARLLQQHAGHTPTNKTDDFVVLANQCKSLL